MKSEFWFGQALVYPSPSSIGRDEAGRVAGQTELLQVVQYFGRVVRGKGKPGKIKQKENQTLESEQTTQLVAKMNIGTWDGMPAE